MFKPKGDLLKVFSYKMVSKSSLQGPQKMFGGPQLGHVWFRKRELKVFRRSVFLKKGCLDMTSRYFTFTLNAQFFEVQSYLSTLTSKETS